MPVTDRSKEFRACVESMRSRSSIPERDGQSKQRQLTTQKHSKSEFARMASSIGKDLSSTTAKLDKLAQLAKRKTLFDDRPVEISVTRLLFYSTALGEILTPIVCIPMFSGTHFHNKARYRQP